MSTTSALIDQALQAGPAVAVPFSIPGLSPAVSVTLLFAIFWLGPFSGALRRLIAELSSGLKAQFRIGTRPYLLLSLMAVALLATSVICYCGAAISVGGVHLDAIFRAVPLAKNWGAALSTVWGGLIPKASWLQFLPISWLATAIVLHSISTLILWLTGRPIRRARERSTRAILQQLEQQNESAEPQQHGVKYY